MRADRETDRKHIGLHGRDKGMTQRVLDVAFLFEILKGKYHRLAELPTCRKFPGFRPAKTGQCGV